MNKSALTAAALALFGISASFVQDPQQPKTRDKELAAIERVGHDYLDALYQCKPELIRRSVHPDLTKLGFCRGEPTAAYSEMKMSYDQLVKLAGSWNRNGNRVDAESVRSVELLDRLDTTAVLKVTAVWGIDYMHVGKFGAGWQAVHILWQSHPSDAK